MATRILLVDDHRIVRESVQTLLNYQPDMEVVGGAADGRTAVALARELAPDLVLMDISLPSLCGIDATRQIVGNDHRIRVLMLSCHISQHLIAQALHAGASGYVVKTTSLDELMYAVRAVAAGNGYLSPEIAGGFIKRFADPPGADIEARALSPLTDREREVLQLVAEGHSTKSIAASLAVCVKTIEMHRHNIMQKLDLHSIAELTKYAIRESLTPS